MEWRTGGLARCGLDVWGTVVRFLVTERVCSSPKHTDRSRAHSYSYLMDYKGFSREVKLEGGGGKADQSNPSCAEATNN